MKTETAFENDYPVVLCPKRGASMPKNFDDSAIFTGRHLSAFLKAIQRAIYSLAAVKQIPAFKGRSSWHFRKCNIDDWIAEQSKNAEGYD